jgi:hypothetical protein
MIKKFLGILVSAALCFQGGITKAESVASFSKTATFYRVGSMYLEEYSLKLGFAIYSDPNGAIPGTWKEYFLLRDQRRIMFITFTTTEGEEYQVWIYEGFE